MHVATYNHATALARELLGLELELACLHGDERLRDSGVSERLREEMLPTLLRSWTDACSIGPLQMMAMRQQVEAALQAWLAAERTPYPSEHRRTGFLAWIWHCVRRRGSV